MRFVTYSNEQKYQINGWFLSVIKAVDTQDGLVFYRWAKTKTDDWRLRIWNDKNKKARLVDRKYFLTADEAYEAGKAKCI